MPEALAEFLDEISLHIEREIAKVPPVVAQALLRDDSPLSTVEMLRFLAQQENAAERNEAARRPSSEDAARAEPAGLSAA